MTRWMARAARLTPDDWLILVRAGVWLLAADLGMRLFGFGRIHGLLQRGLSNTASESGPAAAIPSAEKIARMSYLVDVAADHHLYRMTCLPRALVRQRLLGQAGVDAELKIGVCKRGNRLLAHAWVVHQDKPIGEARDPASLFSALERRQTADRRSGGQSPVSGRKSG